MEEEMETTVEEQGLSKEQLEEQLDGFEASRVVIEQQGVLLTFDGKYYQETLDRKIRANDRKMKMVLSNIEVVKKEMETAKTEAEIIAAAEKESTDEE